MEKAATALKPEERDGSDLLGVVAAARAGDPAALAMLYRRFADAALAVAYRLLLSRADAEDVVHDLFLGLPEALRKYEERGALAAWLKRVTVRLALSRLRAPSRREVALEAAHAVATRPADPAGRIDLVDALAALPASLRAVLVLKEIEGFSHAEIAGMLGISTGASEVRLHRALRTMRRALSEEG
ncbi:MAG TPA: sigma-70 family RNA polymerase sigma factor [Gemmatimonadales bacterium]|nr:sigma-70 family RNA polymerase sigma factor [Gemmatimonadales bacterium]